MYDDILVPTDGSGGTDDTLTHALDIATRRGARVHALSVVDRRIYLSAARDQQDDILESLTESAESAVDAVETRAAGEDVETVGAVRDGVPHSEILKYADEAGIDLIVIGTHGRTGRDKLVNMGSVTERVVENATQPVLVVHIGDD
ncbi:universal stress protein [Salinigranum halophilum]|jgi:nucleotide-binding universal stress UspA family protein|uniref:universal stress protein n=1 Tax=Salinigranum halophilum TaxID=2565931 RepID=UPI0010A89B45|nr:universal stress protein [Salinigranum halophilum]